MLLSSVAALFVTAGLAMTSRIQRRRAGQRVRAKLQRPRPSLSDSGRRRPSNRACNHGREFFHKRRRSL